MDDYIKRLRQYVEANPILFDGEWDHPAMDSLYWHYSESHYGGKTNIAFCQACGKAFIKRGNRQKYCGTLECQSVRNKLKSKEYYYRERAKGGTK